MVAMCSSGWSLVPDLLGSRKSARRCGRSWEAGWSWPGTGTGRALTTGPSRSARPWRQRGELVDLPGAVLAAGASAGLIPAERCVALLAGLRGQRLIPRPSFFQLDNIRKARARGEPWHLIVHEDVLVFRAPLVLKCLSSAGLREVQPEPRSPMSEAPAVPGTRAA